MYLLYRCALTLDIRTLATSDLRHLRRLLAHMLLLLHVRSNLVIRLRKFARVVNGIVGVGAKDRRPLEARAQGRCGFCADWEGAQGREGIYGGHCRCVGCGWVVALSCASSKVAGNSRMRRSMKSSALEHPPRETPKASPAAPTPHEDLPTLTSSTSFSFTHVCP